MRDRIIRRGINKKTACSSHESRDDDDDDDDDGGGGGDGSDSGLLRQCSQITAMKRIRDVDLLDRRGLISQSAMLSTSDVLQRGMRTANANPQHFKDRRRP